MNAPHTVAAVDRTQRDVAAAEAIERALAHPLPPRDATPDPRIELIVRALRFTAGGEAGGTDTEAFDDDERALMLDIADQMDPSA